jgi:hypothetical protein
VSLYWFTDAFPRSIYPYRALVSGKRSTDTSDKPYGFSYFPFELAPAPKAWAEAAGNLVFHREHAKVTYYAMRRERSTKPSTGWPFCCDGAACLIVAGCRRLCEAGLARVEPIKALESVHLLPLLRLRVFIRLPPKAAFQITMSPEFACLLHLTAKAQAHHLSRLMPRTSHAGRRKEAGGRRYIASVGETHSITHSPIKLFDVTPFYHVQFGTTSPLRHLSHYWLGPLLGLGEGWMTVGDHQSHRFRLLDR